jgi:methylated-DNA-protein-cysteine methyltransferase-like protein
VATYGGVAEMAGNARGARQVVRVLHTCSETENLPWWRVVNRDGKIALKPGFGFEEQLDLLRAEGVGVGPAGRIDLKRFLWRKLA